MKETAYRIYDSEDKKMLEVDRLDFEDGKIVSVGHDRWFYALSIDIEKLSQYVGKKDIHGKKMFEGDIGRTTQSPMTSVPTPIVWGPIVYDEESCMYRIIPKGGDLSRAFSIPLDYIEIIGNIWQNPKLLTDSEAIDCD